MVQAPTVNGGKTEDKKAQMITVPFTRASREKTKSAFTLGPTTLTASAQTLNPVQVPPGGFWKWVDIDVACVTAANAANVTFAADGPWNVINFVDLRNSAGDSIIVPFTGYQLYLINKYGALGIDPPNGDPRRSPIFSTTTGAGATGGSFEFMLRIPLEIDPRDAFCALPNLAANKSYQLQFGLSANASIYGTAPTAAGAVTITGVMGYWSQPNEMNAAKVNQQVAPLGNGSVSLWRLQTETVAQGEKLTQLLNVGNVIRMAILVLRTAAGARSASDWPSISQIILNDDILQYLPINFWKHWMAQDYMYNTGAAEAAGGIDNGVYVISDWNNQRGSVKADGPRDQYLVTYNTTLLQLRSTSFGATASSLEIITNDVKPTSAVALYSPNIV
jgi:hypothetical protein